MWYKAKRNTNDIDFSRYIRTRDKWRCVYKFKCNGNIDFSDNPGGLHCSHFQKRRKWSVRYDELNCDSACIPCHYFVENHPEGQKTLEKFKKNQLGEAVYKKLIIRANTRGTKDEKLTKLYIKQLWNSLK